MGGVTPTHEVSASTATIGSMWIFHYPRFNGSLEHPPTTGGAGRVDIYDAFPTLGTTVPLLTVDTWGAGYPTSIGLSRDGSGVAASIDALGIWAGALPYFARVADNAYNANCPVADSALQLDSWAVAASPGGGGMYASPYLGQDSVGGPER